MTAPHERDAAAAGALLQQACGSVHLIGIGGIGMAGLAALLHQSGWRVSGSDLAANRLTRWLSGMSVQVHSGHDADAIPPETAWAIRSTAARSDNVEVAACRVRGIPVFMRGTVLAAYAARRRAIAVSGTHGKTTTTALIAHTLRHAGLAPGHFVGGELDGLPVADAGKSDYFVTEADESDGTVALYAPEICVITNIEYDHMEHFSSYAHMEECLASVMKQTKRLVVYGHDDPVACRLARDLPHSLGYGFSPDAPIQGQIISEAPWETVFEVRAHGTPAGEALLPLHGPHNVANALAAYAVSTELGLSFDQYRSALAAFRPVRRRFEPCGEWNGALVISDYAHHPTAIQGVIAMARRLDRPGRLVVIFQPHRYTRTRALRDSFGTAFDAADRLILCPVYPASELPLPGGASDDLLPVLPPHTRLASDLDEAWELATRDLRPGDTLLVIGAGDVDDLARAYPDALRATTSSSKSSGVS